MPQASKDCKNFEASWQHMELSADIILLVLAEEAMAEMGVSSGACTEQEFEEIVRRVWQKIKVDVKKSSEEITEQEIREDDDQLRCFFLGLYPSFLSSLKPIYPDQARSAVRLKGQKLATQYGDGDALVTFWKLSLVDYHLTNSVSLTSLIVFIVDPVSFQYKYRLCALRLIMAAEGVFGEKVQYDARYNWGVNGKGECI